MEDEYSASEERESATRFRPVTIVNAKEPKRLELKIEVPVEDMARLGQIEQLPSGAASQGPKRTSIWSAIYPRLLEIIRTRTSTLIFVNNRRTAERLAGALNELADETLARAHHGSLAASQRSEIEELLKAGGIKALVATSSLELGIDMGAIDLVIQIEAPPSVASGMQRIGRAGHHVGAASEGIIFPKYRADLVACAAVTRAMHEGLVESTRFLRNPLDVLAQQMVAIVAQPPSVSKAKRKRGEPPPEPEISVEELFQIVRGAAPFAELSRTAFEGVLDLLAGRYPSDEFAELRPRVTWDRVRNIVTPRQGSKLLAIVNGGTIPDRGLYGVFLAGSRRQARSRRRTRRRDGLREPHRRHLHPRRFHLAHRRDHPRPRARFARARPTRQDALLARRHRRTPARVRPPHRRSRPRDSRAARTTPPSAASLANTISTPPPPKTSSAFSPIRN